MRLSKALMKMIDNRARKSQVSRTRLIEWILRDYVNKSDAELKTIVTGPQQEVADEQQVDLFA